MKRTDMRRFLAMIFLGLIMEVHGGEPLPIAKPVEQESPSPSVGKGNLKASGVVEPKGAAVERRIGLAVVIKGKAGERTHRVEVARGMVNRIVTPFATPRVVTSDPIEVTPEGASLFVVVNSESPVSLYVSSGDGAEAWSLELVPSDVTPVEIRIVGDRKAPVGGGQDGEPVSGDGGNHVRGLKYILQTLAKGDIPQGFTREKPLSSQVACVQRGVTFKIEQNLSGPTMNVFIVGANNVGTEAVLLDENACAGVERVLAVAAWPAQWLHAGDKTEVYVVTRTDERR
ncbi:MAG: hypothetical protein G8345_00680 [Magnetococcales bacterium]|nr:type-F conjugative transfer system secretin TraK [Magnetococcales bacterium]NGZ25383.1 hypothetical protein [Magnetococcales bacterium]